MIDLTPYKDQIYLEGPKWQNPGAPFIIVKEIGHNVLQIKVLTNPKRYATTKLHNIETCHKITSIYDLIEPLLVNKNG